MRYQVNIKYKTWYTSDPLTRLRPLSKSTSEKLIIKILLESQRLINIVKDTGLKEVLKVATLITSVKPLSRGTLATEINRLYDA